MVVKKNIMWLLARISLVTMVANATATWSSYNLPVGVTPMSREIFQLHMAIFYICVVIGAGVFAVLFYSIVKHRRSAGAKPAKFHDNLAIEIIWTLIPTLILIVMAVPATKSLFRIRDASKPDINIKVTGYQWKWQYSYLDDGLEFFSNLSTPPEQYRNSDSIKNEWYLLEVDKPLVVPVNKKIRFLITSNDVIHAWWVPELGVKQDAVPGFINETWAKIEKPGIYRGQCSELCGMLHGYMPIVVEAKTEKDYAIWLAQQQGKSVTSTAGGATSIAKKQLQQADEKTNKLLTMTEEDLMLLGKETHAKNCASCHQSNGQGMPPVFPSLIGSKIVIGPILGHVGIVVHGKKGTAMQSFSSQLTDEEIAAVVTYQRNSWGNNDKDKYGENAGGVVTSALLSKAS